MKVHSAVEKSKLGKGDRECVCICNLQYGGQEKPLCGDDWAKT